jgi:hypothetical protein
VVGIRALCLPKSIERSTGNSSHTPNVEVSYLTIFNASLRYQGPLLNTAS